MIALVESPFSTTRSKLLLEQLRCFAGSFRITFEPKLVIRLSISGAARRQCYSTPDERIGRYRSGVLPMRSGPMTREGLSFSANRNRFAGIRDSHE